ncbi:MAG TPA: mechanosensitive ion channel family protein [Clostridiaceae bacterium]|nr:mechanosensitive ion channel family protein [Clostridiaceae bacterium]
MWDIFDEAFLRQHLGKFYTPVIGTLKIIIIIAVSIILIKIGSVLIRKLFERQKSLKFNVDVKKIDTMSSLTVSVFRYVIYLIGGTAILSDVFELKSVLAAAGVGGIAIGLGAQSLIKDVISGFFIILEDQFSVGDSITLDGLTGTVEEIGLRVTKLRNSNGDFYIIPNGEIKKVINHVRGNRAVIVDVPIAYSSDMDRAFDAAQRVCEIVSEEFSSVIVEKPEVQGITSMGDRSMTLRIFARTLPNQQWGVERRIRRLIKDEFDRNNIEFFDRERFLFEKRVAEGGGQDG